MISTVGPKSGWGGVGWGPDRLCQTSPIPRSPDGDNKRGAPVTQYIAAM